MNSVYFGRLQCNKAFYGYQYFDSLKKGRQLFGKKYCQLGITQSDSHPVKGSVRQ